MSLKAARSSLASLLRSLTRVVWNAARRFVGDDANFYAAALAFYSSLSFAPLLILLLWFMGALGPSGQDFVEEQARAFLGPQAGEIVRTVIENSDDHLGLGSVAGILGLMTLLFSASGVFVQLQSALNRIWGVDAVHKYGWWHWLRKRCLSMGMILAVGLLLVISLTLSTAISFLANSARVQLSGADHLWIALEFGVTLGSTILLLAAAFRFLPDVRIAWRDVWFGALTTAALFSAGKFLIGMYLGRGSVGSAYGAAGSLLVLLVWVYYSGSIVLFGAELTRAWADARGAPLAPEDFAEECVVVKADPHDPAAARLLEAQRCNEGRDEAGS
jgi:membrane protein